MASPRSQRGFTIVEMMISLVLLSFIMMGLFGIALSMIRSFREQRQVAAMESAVRGPMDYLTDALRSTSPAVKSGNIQDVATCTTGVLSMVDSTSGPDQLDVTFAYGAVVTSLRTGYTTGTTSITVADASQIFVGDTLLLSNQDQGHLVNVTAVDQSTGVVTLTAPACTPTLPSGGYLAGSLVVRALRARFSVGSVDGIPTLMMDPDANGPLAAEPLAEGIEDMQIALGVDVDGDGTISSTEWAYSAGTGALAGSIRGIRITLVARATTTLFGGSATFVRPAAEDHPISTTPDAYRRRYLTSTIEIRNLGASP